VTEVVFDERNLERLERPERLAELRPPELLARLGVLKAGMTAVDLGCGTGVFSLPLAALVGPAGRVYAVDKSNAMLDFLRARDTDAGIFLIQSDVMETHIPPGAADFCLLAFILHEVTKPGHLMAEAAQLLRPGGSAVVVEWRPDREHPGPAPASRLTKERVAQLFEVAGLKSSGAFDWSDNHYVATAIKA